ncbi:MAG: hypothetical protein ABJO64_00010 [Nitratireductor sp.]
MKKEGNDKKVTSRRSPRHKLAPRDPKGGRPPQEIAAQLGEHILQVALDQFIAHGVEGANMDGSVAKIVKLEHAWRRLDGRNDDGFQVGPRRH